MTSPFPGMDPYLEDPAFWADFHLTFIQNWREAVATALPDDYDARLDESVNLVLLEPVEVAHEFLDELRQARIEIWHRPDRTLVAVLEMLSPYNKTGEGFDAYRNKRMTILLQKVHLVELDLLLGGKRLPMSKPLPSADYYALVSRAEKRPKCEVYSWGVRDHLPSLPIPLRAPDADILIDLAQVFRDTYQRGRYARSLFYDKPPTAPLNDANGQWAVERANEPRTQ